MILIISNKSDIHCNPVIKILNDQKKDFFRLNTEDLVTNYTLTYKQSFNIKKPTLEIINKINNKKINFEEISSIWERRPLTADIGISSSSDQKVKKILQDESNELNWWIRSFAKVKKYIGHYYLDRSNENKLLQLQTASEISKFTNKVYTPDTILSNDYQEIFQFYNSRNVSEIVVKPIGSDSIEINDTVEMPFMSKKVNIQLLKDMEQSIKFCPIFTQKYIHKRHEFRITVIGNKCLTCKIDSQSLPSGQGKEDWREGYQLGPLPQTYIETPKELEKFCLAYLKSTKLNFGCFDFIEDIDHNYVFLECNPNGQWMWMEQETGIPISREIVNYLT